MNERTIIDLFAGIGGFSLAAHWNGVEPAVQVEINPHCYAFLGRVWPKTRQHGDIRTFDARPYRGIWAVMGGPPCQPASRAGKQGGAADDRWLWGEAIRVVDEARPTWCLFENPPGILDVGLDGILADLEGLEYEVQPVSIPACAVDSPQDRERIWILGHRVIGGCEGCNGSELKPDRAAEPIQGLALADGQKQSIGTGRFGRGRPCDSAWIDYEWLACPDPKRGTVLRRAPIGLYEMADGVSSKLLEALGNSIVPQVAAEIIKAMIKADK